MATISRRPKLSLQIAPCPSSKSSSVFGPSMEPISAVGAPNLPFGRTTYSCNIANPTSPRSSRKPAPLLIPARSSRYSRFTSVESPSDSDASEEENRFWSGEENSSATSSEDESSSESEKKICTSNMLNSKPLESPFLPPAPSLQPKKKMQLRLITTIAAAPETETFSPVVPQPMSMPAKRTKLTLTIPLSSSSSSVTSTPASSRKSSLSSGSGSKKSVSFSPLPDSIIENTKYTLSNADLLSYLSSDCSEEELSERWGMSPEEAKMLANGGATRKLSSRERRERKWIGLTNDLLSHKQTPTLGEDHDEER